jgi:PKD repeat protein
MARRLLSLALAAAIVLPLLACGSRKVIAPINTTTPLPPIDITITLPPDATLSASLVSAQRMTLEQALAGGRMPSDLPGNFRGIDAFVIRPEWAVFDSPARLRVRLSEDLPRGTRLFLFRVSTTGHATPIDDGFVETGSIVNFETRTFGFFVIAENMLIARPSDAFLCFGFADRQEGPIPLTVNFRAFAYGGVEPIEYFWDFGDGSEEMSGQIVAHVYYSEGSFEVSVYAQDAAGQISPSFSTTIDATTDFLPLSSISTAVLPTTPAAPFERLFLPVVEGGIPPLEFEWSFSDGFTTTDREVTHDFGLAGIYSGSVTVTDAVRDTASDDFTVDLRHVSLSADVTFGFSPLQVVFEVSAGGVGTGAEVTLDYGDGEVVPVDLEASALYVHTYDEPGTFPAVVQAVEDYSGETLYAYSQTLNIVAVAAPVPVLYSIFPPQAKVGEFVTVYGADFGFAQEEGDFISFPPGVEGLVTQWRDTSIVVQIPEGAEDGDVTVTRTENAVSYESNGMFFDVILPGDLPDKPIISIVSPDRGPVGTVVTILGDNFGFSQGAGDRVSLGLNHLTIHSWGNAVIEAEIPQYAQSGDVIVVRAGMTSNGYHFEVGNFLIDDPPVITSVAPTAGAFGDVVTIFGENFGAYVPGAVVLLGSVPMPALVWSGTELTVTVPLNGYNSDIRVFQNGVLSNAMAFTVYPPAPDLYSVEQI